MPILCPFSDLRRCSTRRSAGPLVFLTVLLGIASAVCAGGDGHWEARPEITATYSQNAAYVGVGKQVTFSVGTPSDKDTWVVNGSDHHEEADSTTTHWTITWPAPSGTTQTHNGNTWAWTAPTSLVGTFTVEVSVDDNRSIVDLRDDYPWTGGGSVVVCRITGLTSEGTLENNKDDHYINLKEASGHVVVTASIEPSWVYGFMLPAGFVTWTGGTASDPLDQLTRWVARTAVSDPTIKAKVGTVDEKTVRVHVVDGGSAFVGPPALTKSRAGDMQCLNPFGISAPDGNPNVTYHVYMPEYSNAFFFSTEEIEHYYRSGTNGGGCHDLLDPWGDMWLYDNWQTAVYDLTPVPFQDANNVWYPKPPRVDTWCSDFSWEHEEFHMEDDHARYWVAKMTSYVIPWVDIVFTYFDCDTGTTTQSAARALEDQNIQDRAAAGENLAWGEAYADIYAEMRARYNDEPKYNLRVAWIVFLWP